MERVRRNLSPLVRTAVSLRFAMTEQTYMKAVTSLTAGL